MARIPLAGAAQTVEPQGTSGNEEMDLLWPEWGAVQASVVEPWLTEARPCTEEAEGAEVRLQEPGETKAWPAGVAGRHLLSPEQMPVSLAQAWIS